MLVVVEAALECPAKRLRIEAASDVFLLRSLGPLPSSSLLLLLSAKETCLFGCLLSSSLGRSVTVENLLRYREMSAIRVFPIRAS